MTPDLKQIELDDEFHLAYFKMENALRVAIQDFIHDIAAQGNSPRGFPMLTLALIEKVQDAMHQVEVEHLGDRYQAMMDRLMAGQFRDTVTKQ